MMDKEENKMSLEAISMKETKSNLASLENHIPWLPAIAYDYAKYVGQNLEPELTPKDFAIAAKVILVGLLNGEKKNSFGNKVPENLQRHKEEVYLLLDALFIPRITDAVLPEAFANKLKQIYLYDREF